MELSFLQILILSALIEFIFLSFVVAIQKKRLRSNNRIFAILLILLSIIIFSSLVSHLNINNKINKISIILNKFLFLLGPLLYFYVKSIFYKKIKFKILDSLHFLPFLLFISSFLLAPYYIDEWPDYQQLIILSSLIGFIFNIFYLAYLVLCLKKLNKYKKIKKIKNRGLKFFIYSSFFLIQIKLALILFQNLCYLHVLDFYEYDQIWYPLRNSYLYLAAIFFYIVTYVVFSKSDLFFRVDKYKNSVIKNEDNISYKKKLEFYMQERKPFLDPEITLNKLAKELNLSPKKLSQIINENYQQNFNDMINKYRIEESKLLFAKPENKNKTIIEILFQVGFNTKSTYNITFKKFTGITPKKYRQSLKK